jgi:hypothetical protein
LNEDKLLLNIGYNLWKADVRAVLRSYVKADSGPVCGPARAERPSAINAGQDAQPTLEVFSRICKFGPAAAYFAAASRF